MNADQRRIKATHDGFKRLEECWALPYMNVLSRRHTGENLLVTMRICYVSIDPKWHCVKELSEKERKDSNSCATQRKELLSKLTKIFLNRRGKCNRRHNVKTFPLTAFSLGHTSHLGSLDKNGWKTIRMVLLKVTMASMSKSVMRSKRVAWREKTFFKGQLYLC